MDERVHPTAEDESLELDGPDGGPGGGASEASRSGNVSTLEGLWRPSQDGLSSDQVLPDAGEAEGARSEARKLEMICVAPGGFAR